MAANSWKMADITVHLFELRLDVAVDSALRGKFFKDRLPEIRWRLQLLRQGVRIPAREGAGNVLAEALTKNTLPWSFAVGGVPGRMGGRQMGRNHCGFFISAMSRRSVVQHDQAPQYASSPTYKAVITTGTTGSETKATAVSDPGNSHSARLNAPVAMP